MESKDLKIANWTTFKEIYPGNVPSKPGLYVFRLDKRFGRLKGSSDILYIGWSKNLLKRLIKNYQNGHGGETTQRVRKYLDNKKYNERVEVGWREDEPQEKEKALLEQYEEAHHELPPWNRQG